MANIQDRSYWLSELSVFLHQSHDQTSDVLINKTSF